MSRPSGDWPAARTPAAGAAPERALRVSDLNRMARRLLESDLPAVWISGEISNLARPASGHWYFSLKDEQAQVRAVMFRGANRGVRFAPANGQTVLGHGRVSLYEARGEFQLILEHLEPAGDGVLRQRLEALVARLTAEGLFARDRKRPLPALPRCVGVITSPTGAAIRDILNVLRRRFPAVPVVLYPVPVQGEAAKHEIVAALTTAAARAECDVLIVARGGGSLEDLWAFNEEMVARAIAGSPIPVVAGVGHEIDVTLADLAADVRAPTPSGAAELVVPDVAEWLRQLARLATRSGAAVRRRLGREQRQLATVAARLQRADPGYRLRQSAQRLDELRARLRGSLGRRLKLDRLRWQGLAHRLQRSSPAVRVVLAREQLQAGSQRALLALRAQLRTKSLELAGVAGKLHAVSPLKTLERGYAIVVAGDGTVVRDATRLAPGDAVTARLARGSITATVTGIAPATNADDALSEARKRPR
jgi:exodeoxyribonuclease VII large subunit